MKIKQEKTRVESFKSCISAQVTWSTTTDAENVNEPDHASKLTKTVRLCMDYE